MGKFSYKKRKGTRKQSFKNRKRVKKGGDKHENKDAAQEEAAPTETVDNTNQDAAAGDAQAGEQQVDNTAENAQTGDAQTGDAQTGQTDTNANEAGNEAETPAETSTTEQTQQNWKEGLSPEAIEQAEKEVTDIEGKANDEGELDPDEIDKLVKQLAEGEDVPPWAKALANSGAAGTAAKILNKNPKLRDALIEKGIEGIKNADVSGAAVNTGAPGAPNTGTGAPGANTGAAAPGGSYTANDAGYQKFVQKVQSDPEVLKNVVYVNNEMSQIFLKKPDGWIEIK